MSLDKTLNNAVNQDFYNYIADAWQYLLGENFHWGYFQSESETLETATDNLIDLLAAPLNIEPTDKLMDVGCGIGGPARYLAGKFGCDITGFSTSQEGIARARKLTEESELAKKPQFEVRNALKNEFDDNSFDSVFLLEMSHLIRDKSKLILESCRSLKIGGRISLCDLTLQRRLTAKEIVKHHKDLVLLERCFGKARLEPLDYYELIFKNCGIEDVKITDISKEVIPTIQNWRKNAETNRKVLTTHISDQDVDDFIRSCDVLQTLYTDGAWGYGAISGVKAVHTETLIDGSFDKALF